MSKNRKKTNLIHVKNKIKHEISKDVNIGKYYIKGTDIEIPENRLCRSNQNPKKLNKTHNYDFSKPYIAQDLGDEWSDYAWSADDF